MKKLLLFFVILLFSITSFGRISDGKTAGCNQAWICIISTTVIGEKLYAAPPQITVSFATLPAFASCIQTTSDSQNFTISGNFLTAGIVVTAPAGFEISKDNSSFSTSLTFLPAGGIVPTSIVYVRMKPTISAVSGSIDVSSTGAATQSVAISGGVGATTTWNGTSWNPVAPTSAMMAIISGNYSQSADLNACYLTISNNAVVSIPSGYDVTLSGALTVDSGSSFTLQNNAGLIQSGTTNPNSGEIKVKRNSSFIKRLDYTLWCSPTFGTQSLQAFSVGTLSNRFYNYNSSTNLLSVVPSPATTNFAVAKGYLIRVSNGHSVTGAVWNGEFYGRPNSGNINVDLENLGEEFAYNFVGNPYPSPINATTFVESNSANIKGTLYFWRKTDGEQTDVYSTWSTAGFVTNGDPQSIDPNGIIQTGQGFVVDAMPSSLNLHFSNDMRTDTHVDQFLKTSNLSEYNRIWLNATSAEGMFSQTLIAYFTAGDDGLDSSDGRALNDGNISLTSLIESVPYTIQGKSLPFNTYDQGKLTLILNKNSK